MGFIKNILDRIKSRNTIPEQQNVLIDSPKNNLIEVVVEPEQNIFRLFVDKANGIHNDYENKLSNEIQTKRLLGLSELEIFNSLDADLKNETGIFKELNSTIEGMVDNVFKPYQITKKDLQDRTNNNFINQITYRISQLASTANTKSYNPNTKTNSDINEAIEYYIKSIALSKYAKDTYKIDYNFHQLAQTVDRVRMLSNKIKKPELGYIFLSWYKNSECWSVGCNNSPSFHKKLENNFNRYSNMQVSETSESILNKHKSWIDAEIIQIEKESFYEEKVKSGIYHVGSDCRNNNCKICLNFDGVDTDDYPLEEKIQPIPPVIECELKNEDDESLCDCWVDRITIRIDLKEQIKLLEKEEAGKLNCKHEKGNEFVCKHCGLLII